MPNVPLNLNKLQSLLSDCRPPTSFFLKHLLQKTFELFPCPFETYVKLFKNLLSVLRPSDVSLKDLRGIPLNYKHPGRYHPYLRDPVGQQEPNFNRHQLASTDGLITEKNISKLRNNSMCSTHSTDRPLPKSSSTYLPAQPSHLYFG